MKKKNETSTVIFIGNYFGYGPSYDGSVFDKNCLCPTLLASSCHGGVPKFIEVKKDEK